MLALGLTRALSALLYGVTASDPRAYIAAMVVLVVATTLAAAVPALRASRVDPLAALRSE
jgi:ABC-type antimicrobial peptide transport system permease subunit